MEKIKTFLSGINNMLIFKIKKGFSLKTVLLILRMAIGFVLVAILVF